ncbi:hypothetical protein U1Q18_016328 [Sarracenia purpurea var. burkii]
MHCSLVSHARVFFTLHLCNSGACNFTGRGNRKDGWTVACGGNTTAAAVGATPCVAASPSLVSTVGHRCNLAHPAPEKPPLPHRIKNLTASSDRTEARLCRSSRLRRLATPSSRLRISFEIASKSSPSPSKSPLQFLISARRSPLALLARRRCRTASPETRSVCRGSFFFLFLLF